MIKAFVTLPGYDDEVSVSDDNYEEDDNVQLTESSEELMEHIPDHIRCFLHSLQNAVKDGLEKTTST